VVRAEQRYPDSTLVRTVLGPAARAANALHQNNPDGALAALTAATPAELGTVAGLVPIYLRGEALWRKGSNAQAAKEFQRILDHRGVDPFAPVVPLAQLGLARATARNGDLAASRREYEQLFTTWRLADRDFGPLADARAEYTALSSSTTEAPQ
jgi:eukaryotic-like serine/threonine-protein kinase